MGRLLVLSLLLLNIFQPNQIPVQGISFPENEYQFLQELYESTNGNSWRFHDNWNFDNITLYNPCTAEWFGVYPVNCDTTNPEIERIQLGYNNLVGTFPPMISNFSQLVVVDVSGNHLYGNLPSFLNLPKLRYISFALNQFSGNLTNRVDKVTSISLQYLMLQSNSFTGPLPVWMYHLPQISYIDVQLNSLDGEIAEDIPNWQGLRCLFLNDNNFVGSVMHSLMYLPNLTIFYLFNNYFHEEIPNSFVSNLFSELEIQNNAFYGSIPNWICEKTELETLLFSENHFEGEFPSCFANKSNVFVLTQITVRKNWICGRLDQVFSNPSSFPNLYILDISHNQFTGPFPAQILNFPHMQIVEASSNCFDRNLDTLFCMGTLSSNLSLINLNGLHTADSCQTNFPLLPSYYGSEMEGTIPFCLWSAPRLDSLGLAGNGLRGSLPSNLSLSQFFTSLSLSHNRLTGSIPFEIQKHPFRTLDLSYNMLSGDVHLVDNISLATIDGSWNISNNRISGHLPDIFHKARNIQVLFGNVFECSEALPENDPNYSNYFCGSSELDYATYGFAVVIGSVLVVFLYLYWEGQGRIREVMRLMWTKEVGLGGRGAISKEEAQSIEQLLATLTHLIEFGGYCFLFVLLVLLPLILVLNTVNIEYRKYEYEYNWISTASNLRGVAPTVWLFLLWLLIIVFFLSLLIMRHASITKVWNLRQQYFLSKCCGTRLQDTTASIHDEELRNRLIGDPQSDNILGKSPSNSVGDLEDIEINASSRRSEKTQFWFYLSSCAVILLLNVAISITINVLYLMSLDKTSRWNYEITIQLLMAMFKLIWNFMIVNNMTNQLQQSFTKYNKETFQLRIFLLVFNNILAPCIASIVYDGSCFHDLFFGTQYLTEEEEYAFEIFGVTYTAHYTGNGFQLPFMYYYSCGSQILRSYIPIFLYTYTLLPIKNIIEFLLLSIVQISSWMPKRVYSLIPGIFRPGDYRRFPILFRRDSMMALLVLHLSVLFTFGLTTPILAMLVVVVIVLDCVGWKYIILRFINYPFPIFISSSSCSMFSSPLIDGKEMDNEEQDAELTSILESKLLLDEDSKAVSLGRLKALNDSLQDSSLFVFHARWSIFYCSMLFIGLLLFDFVGDEQGAVVALWVPIVVICFILLTRFFLADALGYLNRFLDNTADIVKADALAISEDVHSPFSL